MQKLSGTFLTVSLQSGAPLGFMRWVLVCFSASRR